MSTEAPARPTPLHSAHVTAGARMVDFAGWSMPVQYTGVVDEHLAVRTRAGLFDVSHMGEVRVRGRQALDLLQKVTCNDVAKLAPGKVHYNGLMTGKATFVDDLLISRNTDQDYLVVVNASNAAKDVAYIREQARGLDVEVVDESDEWALLALQGPRAAAILAPLVEIDVAALRYYAFAASRIAGTDGIVSRTGYTGEDGFELFVPPAAAEPLWNALLSAGAPEGLVPVGLGARDTLRLEAKMALYGNDIDDTTTPLEADLGWIVKTDKGPFLGRDVLLRQREEGIPRKLAGFEMKGKVPARHGYPVLQDGREVGTVTSGSFAPFLRKNIGLAYLPPALTEPGTPIEIGIRGRGEPATVVPTPFYKRPR